MKRALFLSICLLLSVPAWGKMFERRVHTITDEQGPGLNQRWIHLATTPEESLGKLVALLAKSQTGRTIIKSASAKAKEQGQSLKEVLFVGESSLTDTTLMRRFVPTAPDEVTYETKSVVYLNRHLSVFDGLIDLAHELTHFNERQAFNPYRVNFTLKEFIASTVEGPGGEVEAYLSECQVLKELFPDFIRERSNCANVMEDDGGLSREKGIAHFYRIGGHMQQMQKELERYRVPTSDFPRLSGDTPIFISSAYGLPYPIAAVHEYTSIMGKACENDRRRLSLMEMRQAREPASEQQKMVWQRMTQFFKSRCQDYVALN
jgi:hypothetical protein